jgi:glycosyltransferase involved in cell wall biosynthesis
VRVLISALRLIPGRSLGGETYFRGLLHGLTEAGHSKDVCVAVGQDAEKWMRETALWDETVSVPMLPSVPVRLAAERLILKRIVRKSAPDVVFFPFNMMAPTNCPSVVMIHDLIDQFYRTHRIEKFRLRQFLRELAVRKAIFTADRIVVPSQAIADEIVAVRPSLEGSVVVIAEAALDAKERPARVSMSERDSYLLLQPGCYAAHKNSFVIMHALAEIGNLEPQMIGRVSVVFSSVGKMRSGLEALARQLRVQDNVTLLDRVGDKDFEELWARVDAVVLPSLYEGFGLPITEAHLREVPVLASDIPVFHEASGGAALFFDPHNPRQLASQIIRLLSDSELRNQMTATGAARGRTWSWSGCAEKLWDVFEACALASSSQDAGPTSRMCGASSRTETAL